MLEAQGEPERSSACNRANPGRKERRGFHPVGRNFARIVDLLASIPSHLSGGQSLGRLRDPVGVHTDRLRHRPSLWRELLGEQLLVRLVVAGGSGAVARAAGRGARRATTAWTPCPARCKTPPVGYADLKNDVVFRKVFGQHPRVLAGLLNDLLDRSGDRAIAEIEYLPGEQVPLVLGLKLSILDVRCREKGGAAFIVEMQMLHVTGFLNRVVYNACKAYVGALKKGAAYGDLVDVMAVSICDLSLIHI